MNIGGGDFCLVQNRILTHTESGDFIGKNHGDFRKDHYTEKSENGVPEISWLLPLHMALSRYFSMLSWCSQKKNGQFSAA